MISNPNKLSPLFLFTKDNTYWTSTSIPLCSQIQRVNCIFGKIWQRRKTGFSSSSLGDKHTAMMRRARSIQW